MQKTITQKELDKLIKEFKKEINDAVIDVIQTPEDYYKHGLHQALGIFNKVFKTKKDMTK